jgi:hypothetical protein
MVILRLTEHPTISTTSRTKLGRYLSTHFIETPRDRWAVGMYVLLEGEEKPTVEFLSRVLAELNRTNNRGRTRFGELKIMRAAFWKSRGSVYISLILTTNEHKNKYFWKKGLVSNAGVPARRGKVFATK